jgi:hypothetical protein
LLTLYYAPGACSMAPHIALEETGATFAAIRIDEVGGEHLTEAYTTASKRKPARPFSTICMRLMRCSSVATEFSSGFRRSMPTRSSSLAKGSPYHDAL